MRARNLAIVVLGGGVLAALTVALPVLLANFVQSPAPVSSVGVRLPYAPADYPDPNITWTTRRLGLVEESSIRGIGVLDSWHVSRLRAGWPLPMLEGGSYSEIHSTHGEAASSVRHTVTLKTWWSKDLKSRWELPTGLVWGGLGVLGNWAVWSAAVGLFFVPGAIRRALRIRRRLCLNCGYPRDEGAAVCPECGMGAGH